MKKTVLFLSIFALMQSVSQAQDSSYRINGRLENIKGGTIYLRIYKNGETFIDSSSLNKGKFEFTGYVSSPYFASLTIPDKKNDYFTFYIEPVTMEISGRGDSLRLLTIKGSPVNADDKLLKERMKSITQWEEGNSKIYEKAYKDKNKKVIDSLDKVDNDILAAKRKVVSAFVKEYPGSIRGAMAIIENFSYYAEASDVEPLYNELTPAVQQSRKGRQIKQMIVTYSRVAIGKKAPDFTQLTPDSTQLSLSSLEGKYVLIDFWASWCGPCRRENPNIVNAYNQFRNKNFTILGVSYDTKKDRWVKAIADDHLDWNQVSDLKGWQNSTSNQYGIKAIPSNVLVDKNGIIVAKNIFGEEVKEKLKELLK